MLITSYYRGATDKVSGVTFDTEKHTFKTWSLEPDEWSHTYKKGNNVYSTANDDFAMTGDIDFYHAHKYDLNKTIEKLKALGFIEDDTIVLNFKKNA